jgi:hypothetical protein
MVTTSKVAMAKKEAMQQKSSHHCTRGAMFDNAMLMT